MIADRTFYCHHCWTRLVSYLDQQGVYFIEEDATGEKWGQIKKQFSDETIQERYK